MKFADRPAHMTPGQEKWLRSLLGGPKALGRYGAYPRSACLRKGWTRWYWATADCGAELSDDEAIETPIESRIIMAEITDSGREALQKPWEQSSMTDTLTPEKREAAQRGVELLTRDRDCMVECNSHLTKDGDEFKPVPGTLDPDCEDDFRDYNAAIEAIPALLSALDAANKRADEAEETLAAYGRAREQGGVNEDALRALAQAYDREDAAQRGEPDPWNLDDPGDIGDSDTWVSERLACARAAAEAFLSALEPAAPEGRQEDGLAPLFQPSHRGGV